MYQYRYKTTRGEYWKMSMYFIYQSMTGMVNLVFTAALLALTFAKWGSSGNIFRICMVLGCCLFTIFQPLAIYLSAGKLASASGEDTEIRLDDVGIQVKVGNTYDKIPWRKIVRIAKLPGMAIIFTDPSHGYLLTDRVVGEDKKAFYDWLMKKQSQTLKKEK